MGNMTAGSRRQRGVVLIVAILMVALIAGIASSLGLGQQLWLRQTENLNERALADSLRHSALGWIAMLLTRDAKEPNKTDHLGELWAKQLPPLPAEGGMIAVSIRDAQGLFNLNNLVRNNAPSQPDIAVFRQILQAQELDPALIEPLINALIDWIDPDNDKRPGGAEDVDYLAGQPPYRTANQPLTSVDELRLVRGFTPKVVEALRPLVTALPEPVAINVNTATEPVLAALLPGAAGTALQPLLRRRETQPFQDIAQFQQQLPPGTPGPQAAVAVKTGYFLVSLVIKTGRLERRSEALIARPEGRPAEVLWQRLNPIVPEVKSDEKG
jgi:general secretion pathway protein K